ncbi:MAG: sigma-70 family RNA polymerase sigma factor [Planctomycetes bacterium]|nr:sigma-70 family RNA polymerase sigma factor [Planctomycetota bacterium]
MTPIHRDPQVLLEHAGYVRALARELVFDAHLARDLEQDVWLAALQNVPSDLRHPRAWLATIARNLAWRARRGSRRRAEREERSAHAEVIPSSEVVLEREELRAAVVRAVLALDEPSRSALVLRYLEEVSPDVAAKRLGVPLETFRTRVKRGLQELRARMERDHDGDHGAWCLALVTELRLEPESAMQIAWKAAAALFTGGLVVSTTHKVLGSAAAVVLLVLAWIAWNPLASGGSSAPRDALAGRADLERELVEPEPAGREIALQPAPKVVAALVERELDRRVGLHVEWSDGTPAAGLAVRLRTPQGDEEADARTLRTDAQGDVAFDALPACVGSLVIDRWRENVSFDLWSAKDVRKTVRLPAGVDLVGRVRTRDGRPVADARILATGYDERAAELEIARSDADGAFRVRNLAEPAPEALLACKDGFAASAAVELYRAGGLARTVELVLDDAGGALEGRVLGQDGRPADDAMVLAGDPSRFRVVQLEDGASAIEGLPLATRTDAAGDFRLEGLVPGATRVLVRPRTKGPVPLAAWSGEVEIVAGRTARLDVNLEPGVELTGTVTDSAGAPVFGALVELEPSRLASPLEGYRAQTSPDGTYRLANVRAGAIELVASANERGEARTVFHARAGTRHEWNPWLGKGLVLRGRVDRAGRETGTLDLVAWIVRDGRPEQVQTAYAFEDGLFEFTNRPDLPHHVEVRSRGAASTILASADGVRPGAEELVLALDARTEPTARMRGRLVGADGAPVRTASFFAFCAAPMTTVQEGHLGASGEFEVGPLPAGTWSLRIEAPGHALYSVEGRKVNSGEDVDLGVVQLVKGGTVHVRARRSDGAPLGSALAQLQSIEDGSHDAVPLHDGAGRSRELAPGRVRVVVHDPSATGFAIATTTVEVAPGAATECELVLVPGVSVDWTWTRLRAAEPAEFAGYVVLDESGTQLLGAPLEFGVDGIATASACFAPGRYRVESYPARTRIDEFTIAPGADTPLRRAVEYR